jgi:type IV secretory pathway VirB4 component
MNKQTSTKKISKQDLEQEEHLYQRGMATVRGFVAPSALNITSSFIEIGGVYTRTLFVMTYPKYLSNGWFSPIINIDFPMDTAMFIHPMDSGPILKDLQKQSARILSQIKIEREGGQVRDPVLENALENVERLRDDLQTGTERFFRFGLYTTIYASSQKELDDMTNQVQAILESQMIYTKPAILRMDQGYASTIPLANDELDLANNLNTSPVSTTFPFVSSELSSNEGVLYGINRHNNSLILFDRFKMENANMVIFAKSGAGKSYTVKLEILRSLMFGITSHIIDPENEYEHLCSAVGGSYIPISLNSDYHINPLDLPKIEKGEDDPEGVFRSHIASVIGLLHIMLGSVTPEEDSILDKAIREAYAIRDITPNSNFYILTPEHMPTMTDVQEVLSNMQGAQSLSARLEKYTEGIFSGFINHKTNIKTDGLLTTYNIRDLEDELRPIAMYVVLQHIWNEMRRELKKRFLIIDEAWIMMQHEDAASFVYAMAKRCRKYYTGLTTITQDIADFMTSRYGKPIVTNSSLQLLLRQSPASIDVIQDVFYLTDQEKFLLLESNVGEGIFFAGLKHVAIRVVASYSEDQIITSNPQQLLEIEEAKKEFDEQTP